MVYHRHPYLLGHPAYSNQIQNFLGETSPDYMIDGLDIMRDHFLMQNDTFNEDKDAVLKTHNTLRELLLSIDALNCNKHEDVNQAYADIVFDINASKKESQEHKRENSNKELAVRLVECSKPLQGNTAGTLFKEYFNTLQEVKD